QFYSTESGFDPMLARHPKARRFETRDATRGRLLQVALEQRCEPPAAPVWTAQPVRAASASASASASADEHAVLLYGWPQAIVAALRVAWPRTQWIDLG
ncbi:hypothetical protein HKX41_11080, partial [Salinisphaera sp. USBA-960]|nr:hypothetical protein [Salifodinibacter halophilus]